MGVSVEYQYRTLYGVVDGPVVAGHPGAGELVPAGLYLVADLHRTLLYGGWAGNPRAHLRRVYEAAPLSAVTVAAGGRATDGRAASVLDVCPEALHSRAPFFAGSRDDITELLSFGDVRQTGKKKYDV